MPMGLQLSKLEILTPAGNVDFETIVETSLNKVFTPLSKNV